MKKKIDFSISFFLSCHFSSKTDVRFAFFYFGCRIFHGYNFILDPFIAPPKKLTEKVNSLKFAKKNLNKKIDF